MIRVVSFTFVSFRTVAIVIWCCLNNPLPLNAQPCDLSQVWGCSTAVKAHGDDFRWCDITRTPHSYCITLPKLLAGWQGLHKIRESFSPRPLSLHHTQSVSQRMGHYNGIHQLVPLTLPWHWATTFRCRKRWRKRCRLRRGSGWSSRGKLGHHQERARSSLKSGSPKELQKKSNGFQIFPRLKRENWSRQSRDLLPVICLWCHH